MRRSTVLSLPPQLAFPGCSKKTLRSKFVDVEGGGHQDDLHAPRIRVDELLDEEHHEVQILFAIVNLVQDYVGPLREGPAVRKFF